MASKGKSTSTASADTPPATIVGPAAQAVPLTHDEKVDAVEGRRAELVDDTSLADALGVVIRPAPTAMATVDEKADRVNARLAQMAADG